MIKCSKCNEMIGENQKECPFCKHIITDEERMKAFAENEVLHEVTIQKAMEEYRRRLKTGIIVDIIIAIIVIAGAIFISFSDVYLLGLICLLVAVQLLCAICMFKFRVGICPYCESIMPGSILFRSHCPRCGGRLR